MPDTLEVYLHGQHAGTLAHTKGDVTFTYLESWRAFSGAVPLSLSMPLARASHPAGVVMPFIDGLLPDDDDVRRRWQRTFGETRSTPYALLRHTGLDCAGAVQICPPGVDPGGMSDGDRVGLSEAEIADHLRQLRRDPTAWSFADHGGQFSLAGAQSKFALALRDGSWERPSGNLPTTHIVKPEIAGLDASALNEHLCLEAARRLGINAATSRFLTFQDQAALVVDRYDRRFVGDNVQRIHQEDLCQALGYYPAERYENEGGPGIMATCELLRRAAPPVVATDSVKRFLEANAFNWLIAGTDAHAKNYSILLSSTEAGGGGRAPPPPPRRRWG
jgi:serine/threonine-protein kinase HipA